MNRIVPVEDNEISKELEKSLKKKGISILTSSEVKNATVNDDGNVDVVIAVSYTHLTLPTNREV